MSREVVFNTLHGDVITLEVLMGTTVGELKAMLVEKHKIKIEDPIERKILKVELLQNGSIIEVDDGQTLGAVGLLEANKAMTATVIYKRNNVEAETKDGLHRLGFFHLNIPSDCTKVCKRAFQECIDLVSVTITQSVTRIGEYAFQGCTSLASITLGESVKHIGTYAFKGCTSLTSVTLGESVTLIGAGAFEECTSLASITLGESVTHIDNQAFKSCTSLASITLGKFVTDIGGYAFAGCS